MFMNRKFIAKVVLLVFMISFLFPVFSLASEDVYVWSSDVVTSSVSANTTDNSNSLNLECSGAVLIEQNSGKVLYDHNMHEILRPASVT